MYFDTHAHLDQPEFDADREQVIGRARAAGVMNIVAIGITAASSAACFELANKHPGLHAAVGIQPNHCAEAEPGDWDRIVELLSSPGVVAIGETGLDRYWDYTPLPVQQDYFARHLELARLRGLPFIVHTRESDADVLTMLRDAAQESPLRGVMHSFTGTLDTALECVELGLHISFAGMVTFQKSDALREVARQIPLNRLLIETDSPYLAPHPLRGKRNEPANVIHTAACLADGRGMTVEELGRATAENARKLFGVA